MYKRQFPSIRGNPSSPLPTTTTLELLDSANFKVASIPLSLRIFGVKDAAKILFASALPRASILCFSASLEAVTSLNSYSRDSCSCFNFLSIASLIEGGSVTSLTSISFN